MPSGIETEVDVTAQRIDKPKVRILVNEKITELYGFTAKSLAAPVVDDNYGINWPGNLPQYFKEAKAYRTGGMGGHDKLFHMINMIKLDLPGFQFESRGYINSNALRVLKGLVENDDLGIAGAASTGKTFPVGAYILQDWKSAPGTTLSFVCTTSLAASEDRIWGAIVKMFQDSKHKIGTYIQHKYVIAFGNFSDSASDRDYNSAIKAIAIPLGNEGRKSISALRGRKQLNVRLVFDELPEMETYVSHGAINLESNTRDTNPEFVGRQWGLQVVYIGNPNDENDAHGQACRPDDPLGYKSINKETPQWQTRTGLCIFLNGEWSPNFEAPPDEPIPFPRLTNRVALQKMLARCHNNVNSLEYWRNAIGFWPNTSVLRTIMTTDLLKARKAHDPVKWRVVKRINICGFDLGFTAGGDKCVAQFGQVGVDQINRTVCQWMAERVYHAEVGQNFEDAIAKQLVDDCIRFDVKPNGLGLDISGDGGKMLSAIIRYWIKINPNAAEVFPISSMGKPSDRIVSNVDKRQCDEAFDRRVTEYWMMIREGVECEVLKGIPLVNELGELHEIVDQLCSRIYSIVAKKFSIETKDNYKDRTGKDSPDNADSYVYMIEMARRHGLVFNTPHDETRKKERDEVRKSMDTRSDYNYESDDWGEKEDAA